MAIPALRHEHAGNLPVLLQHPNELLHLKQVVSNSWPELDSHPRAYMGHAHNATHGGFLVRHSDAEYYLAPCREGRWRFDVTCTDAYISQSVGRYRRCRPGCACCPSTATRAFWPRGAMRLALCGTFAWHSDCPVSWSVFNPPEVTGLVEFNPD